MQTRIVKTSDADERSKAVVAVIGFLQAGEIVALPTETVYGLAADALNPLAVAKVFEAKERPRFDPLIVHLPNRSWLEKTFHVPEEDRKLVTALAEEFWPGPFTVVLPKQPIVPDIVTAGLNTVAVRISAHPVFSEVVRTFGKPLAAPSANRFGCPSPTDAQHALDELNGRIPLIVDGGRTQYGIESTIVAVRRGKIDLVRPGPITTEQLSSFAETQIVSSPERISAPGQLPSHYSPKTPLRLLDQANDFIPEQRQRVALLAWNLPPNRGSEAAASNQSSVKSPRSSRFIAVRQLSENQDPCEAAANLFRYLRELDRLNLDLIVAERVPPQGIGAAINDRLERAAAK